MPKLVNLKFYVEVREFKDHNGIKRYPLVVELRGIEGATAYFHTDGLWRQTVISKLGYTGHWYDGDDWRGEWTCAKDLATRALRIWMRHLPEWIVDDPKKGRPPVPYGLRKGKQRHKQIYWRNGVFEEH
jgi:hypothetical protein